MLQMQNESQGVNINAAIVHTKRRLERDIGILINVGKLEQEPVQVVDDSIGRVLEEYMKLEIMNGSGYWAERALFDVAEEGMYSGLNRRISGVVNSNNGVSEEVKKELVQLQQEILSVLYENRRVTGEGYSMDGVQPYAV